MNPGNFGFPEAIAFIAVVVAFYYGWQNSKLTKKLLEKESGEARERLRADVGANIVKLGKNEYRLKIFNRGKSAARNVRIELPEDDDLLIKSDLDSKFPHEHLDPHQGIELIAVVGMSSKSKHPMKLIWDDDFKRNNEKMAYPTT